jgi:hypothetical protein
MLNKGENGRANDLDSLMRVKDLSWLSGSEMTGLASGLVMCSFKKHEVIVNESRLATESNCRMLWIGRS